MDGENRQHPGLSSNYQMWIIRYIFLMAVEFIGIEDGRSAASETDVIEGRVVDHYSAVRADAGLHSANAVQALGAVVAPVAARVAQSVDFAVVGAFESDVVDGRVVGRVASRADPQLEALHEGAERAILDVLEAAGAIMMFNDETIVNAIDSIKWNNME